MASPVQLAQLDSQQSPKGVLVMFGQPEPERHVGSHREKTYGDSRDEGREWDVSKQKWSLR